MKWDIIDKKLQDYLTFPEEQRRMIDKELKIDALEAENDLEKNSLIRSDISILLKSGLSIGGKSFTDHLETFNHAEAYDWVQSQTGRSVNSIDLKDILYIHLLLSKGLEIHAGRMRTGNIHASAASTQRPSVEAPLQLMGNLIAWLQMAQDQHAIDLAIEAHYRLLLISPFQNRNGRVARMLMNMILQMHGYPMCLIEAQRLPEYVSSVDAVRKTGSLRGLNTDPILRAIDYSLDIRLKILGDLNRAEDTPAGEELLKIGELAKAVGEATSTIRYWMKKGLIAPVKTLPSGYQLFDRSSLLRAKHIQSLKLERYSLAEIFDILSSSAFADN